MGFFCTLSQYLFLLTKVKTRDWRDVVFAAVKVAIPIPSYEGQDLKKPHLSKGFDESQYLFLLTKVKTTFKLLEGGYTESSQYLFLLTKVKTICN